MEHMDCTMGWMTYWEKVLFINDVKSGLLVYDEC